MELRPERVIVGMRKCWIPSTCGISMYLMGIKWQDKITNNKVLQRAKMDGMEAMLVEMGWSCAANE